MPSYMFDTNVFNRILDGAVEMSEFRGKAHFYATHVQHDELKRTSNTQRRQELIAVFEEVIDTKVPTESFVLDGVRLDEARLGSDGDQTYTAMKGELDKLNRKNPNNTQDALIAETAYKNQFTLVTEDTDLLNVAKKFGGKCADIKQMMVELGT